MVTMVAITGAMEEAVFAPAAQLLRPSQSPGARQLSLLNYTITIFITLSLSSSLLLSLVVVVVL